MKKIFLILFVILLFLLLFLQPLYNVSSANPTRTLIVRCMEDWCYTPTKTATRAPTPTRTITPTPTLTPIPTIDPICTYKHCHEIKFYLPTSYESTYGLVNLRTWLSVYIQDMNTILDKNTNRWLIFNPYIDIIFTDVDPHSNQFGGQKPDYNFEIWAVVRQSQSSHSHGGYAGIDSSGAGALAGMFWLQVYNPSIVTGVTLTDYWTQINNMLHELAHVFGAGMGEYYNLCTVVDTTGIPPLQNISCSNGINDPYWEDKPDYFSDPLLRDVGYLFTTREQILNYVQYSNLTSIILNNPYRNGLPIAHYNTTIHIVDQNFNPIPVAKVKVWSIRAVYPDNTSSIIADGDVDEHGEFFFEWGVTNPHNNYDMLRLIKVYKPGYTSIVKYYSVFDADYFCLTAGPEVDVSITIILYP